MRNLKEAVRDIKMRENRRKELEKIKAHIKTLMLYCYDDEREQALKELEELIKKLNKTWR